MRKNYYIKKMISPFPFLTINVSFLILFNFMHSFQLRMKREFIFIPENSSKKIIVIKKTGSFQNKYKLNEL